MLRILLATDAFPPVCGGSGWSTYELARGLRARGHEIVLVQPRPGTPPGVRTRTYDGFPVLEFGAAAPGVPYLRNYFKNERLWSRLSRYLTSLIGAERIDIVHAQHVLTTVPSIQAAHAAGIPAVCTIRDYWPVCYWADLIDSRDPRAGLCSECTIAGMTRGIQARGRGMWPLAVPMIPYMRANLARKRAGVAAADAVIAVSSTIAADLRHRAPELSNAAIDVIPNAVDVDGLLRRAAEMERPLDGPYALYVGKLAPNKGTAHLVDVAARARLDWPLVIAGDGPDRAALAAQASASGRDIRLIGWVDRDTTIAWLAHAAMLVFPSRGPESLSRVLLEASALGLPIAAMNTGGTADIIEHEVTGLLSDTPEALARDVERIRRDGTLRHRLGAAARDRARRLFDASAVIARIEAVYERVRRAYRNDARSRA